MIHYYWREYEKEEGESYVFKVEGQSDPHRTVEYFDEAEYLRIRVWGSLPFIVLYTHLKKDWKEPDFWSEESNCLPQGGEKVYGDWRLPKINTPINSEYKQLNSIQDVWEIFQSRDDYERNWLFVIGQSLSEIEERYRKKPFEKRARSILTELLIITPGVHYQRIHLGRVGITPLDIIRLRYIQVMTAICITHHADQDSGNDYELKGYSWSMPPLHKVLIDSGLF